MESEELGRFIESWGSMGILWGINRSMARIHAYLLVCEEPVDSETISDDLNISRGNVSMCLKELRTWGVIRRVNQSGDRRDYFEAEADPWNMLYRIAVGRKQREFDPALQALRHLLTEMDADKNAAARERLAEIEELMTTLDSLISRFLISESKSKTVLEFMKSFGPK